MTTNLNMIKTTLANISRGNGILDSLLEFERTLDNAEVFAYKNWILGELVEGPVISRYWFKTVWMWSRNMMPDPNAGLRLTKLGARVSFRKGIFERPTKVNGPQDWVDPQSKRAKMIESEVWLVTIELPIKYIDRGLSQAEEIIQQDLNKTNSEITDAYEDQSDGEDLEATAGDINTQDAGTELPPMGNA